jgi:anthranilate synthase component 2
LCKEKHFPLKVKILLVDFYDSFTYNLAHYIEPLCDQVDVIRDNEIKFETISNYDKIILSPGPGLPENTQSMRLILENFSGTIPILGVCLGMQGIVQFLGGSLTQKKMILHGKPVQLRVEKQSILFADLPAKFKVGLYHSWEVKVPDDKKHLITAYDEHGVIMAIEHPEKKLVGVQFHPESILTEYGREILVNFCKLT